MGSVRKKPDPYMIDEENAPLTDEEIKTLRPAREFFAERGWEMPKPVGRPPVENPKRQVTLRLDAEIVDAFKAGGKGWQTRINDALAKSLKSQSKRRA
jgi:uncharacterized protein (DUF4415 family)